jgi:hypothetical protein
MRTTIRLDDQLLKSAKSFAHETGRTLTAVIEDALRRVLAQRPAKGRRTHVKLTTVKGRGTRPGIDLDDSASLLAAMEEPNGSA